MSMRSFRRPPASALAAAFIATLTLAAGPPETAAQDLDGDGWTVADGDCADVPSGSITSPELVNPGAYDIPLNGIDDDCDGIVDNPTPITCSTVNDFTATAVDLANALDLCQTTTMNPPPNFKRWGLISAQLLRASGATAPAAVQSGVKMQFGANVFPVAGATMALISTGTARDASDPGFVAPSAGYASGLGAVVAPADFTGPNGGLYYEPGCLQPTDPVYDSVRLRLVIRVPTNANGFQFWHRFFSSEYPDQCSIYSDHLLALLTSAAPGLPPNKNILFDSQLNPMTVQTAFFQVCLNCQLNDADLVGTGYSTLGDGGTGWNASFAPVLPGEVITLEFHIWDSGDELEDALAILDGFDWTFLPQTVDVATAVAPAELGLRVGPNPFTSSTSIQLALPAAGRATIEILDTMGRRVRRLADRDFAAGVAHLSWDGTDDAGIPARAGTYFVRTSVGESQVVRRVVLRR